MWLYIVVGASKEKSIPISTAFAAHSAEHSLRVIKFVACWFFIFIF